jgi:hypothetical protein
MRGLISAALVLAPALASAPGAYEVHFDHEQADEIAAVGIYPFGFC